MTDGVPGAWLTHLDGLGARPIADAALTALAARRGDTFHSHLGAKREVGGCAEVSIGSTIRVSPRGRGAAVVMCCETLKYEFRRSRSGWEFDLVGMTVI